MRQAVPPAHQVDVRCLEPASHLIEGVPVVVSGNRDVRYGPVKFPCESWSKQVAIGNDADVPEPKTLRKASNVWKSVVQEGFVVVAQSDAPAIPHLP